MRPAARDLNRVNRFCWPRDERGRLAVQPPTEGTSTMKWLSALVMSALLAAVARRAPKRN